MAAERAVPSPTLDLVVQVVPRPRLLRLVVAGELDLSTAYLLSEGLQVVDRASLGRYEVDLGAVTFADCSGARPLLEACRSAAARGGAVVVAHPRAVVARVLRHLGLRAPLSLTVTAPAGARPAPPASV